MRKLSFEAHQHMLHIGRTGAVQVRKRNKRAMHYGRDMYGVNRQMKRIVFDELLDRGMIQQTRSKGWVDDYDVSPNGADYIRAWANNRHIPRAVDAGTA